MLGFFKNMNMKILRLEHSYLWCWKLDIWENRNNWEIPERGTGKGLDISRVDLVRYKEVLYRAQEERNILPIIKEKTALFNPYPAKVENMVSS